MKKIIYILIICVVTILSACNEYEAPTAEYGLPGVVTNIKSNKKVNLNAKYAFKDLSLGVTSRKWSFSKDVKFITGNETSNFIEVMFTEVGDCSVNIKDDFVNDVKLDSTFVVEVLDSIQTDFMASCPGFIDNPSTEPIEIEAGESVHFTSLTKGRPTQYTWVLDGSNEGIINNFASILDEQTVECDAHYYIPGTYDVKLIAQRTDPWGQDTLVVKNYVKVNTTNKKADIIGFEQTSDDNLLISCSLPIDPSTINKDDFKVTRNGNQIAIVSLELSSTSPTQLLMKVDGGAWNGDDIFLSYKEGNVKTLMGTDLLGCIDLAFTPYIINLVPNSGFEDGSWSHEFGTSPFVQGSWVSYPGCELSFEIKHSGAKSQYMNKSDGKILNLTNATNVNMKAGEKYSLEYWIYVKEVGSYGEARFGMTSDNFYTDAIVGNWHGKNEFPIGEWHKVRDIYTLTDNYSIGKFKFHLIGIGAYIDDFAAYKLNRHE